MLRREIPEPLQPHPPTSLPLYYVLYLQHSASYVRKTPSLLLLDTPSILESCYSRTSLRQFFCIIPFFFYAASVRSAYNHCCFSHLKKNPCLVLLSPFSFSSISLLFFIAKLKRIGDIQCCNFSSVLTLLQSVLLCPSLKPPKLFSSRPLMMSMFPNPMVTSQFSPPLSLRKI